MHKHLFPSRYQHVREISSHASVRLLSGKAMFRIKGEHLHASIILQTMLTANGYIVCNTHNLRLVHTVKTKHNYKGRQWAFLWL